MNVGEFRSKIDVLSLTNTGNSYAWSVTKSIFAKAERLSTKNIFSSVGFAAKSVKFTLRKRPLTLHNALRWQGMHCFLTDIVEIDPLFIEVTAALVEPKLCMVKRTGAPTLNERNNPVYGDPILVEFPAIQTEKYLGRTQSDPQVIIETQYVLVTPKPITLAPGELVMIEGTSYEVLLGHTLDEYKNEYEVSARSDS